MNAYEKVFGSVVPPAEVLDSGLSLVLCESVASYTEAYKVENDAVSPKKQL